MTEGDESLTRRPREPQTALGRKLHHLEQTVINPDTNKPYTRAETARKVSTVLGEPVARQMIGDLVSGKVKPKPRILDALAEVFLVDPQQLHELDPDAEAGKAVERLLQVIAQSPHSKVLLRSLADLELADVPRLIETLQDVQKPSGPGSAAAPPQSPAPLFLPPAPDAPGS